MATPEAKECGADVRKLNINEWMPDSRPREKFELHGPQALTSAELLAILIGSGSPRETAVGLMDRILSDRGGSLRSLGRMEIDELCRYNGVGKAKAITILAACELGRRRAEEPAEERPQIRDSRSIYDEFRRLEDSSVEEFHVLLLNQNLRSLGTVRISLGGITSTAVDVRLILREAILRRATAIAVCHNHPSGNPQPSREDDRLTERIGTACKTLDLRFVDHIIVGDGRYYSYNDQGRLA